VGAGAPAESTKEKVAYKKTGPSSRKDRDPEASAQTVAAQGAAIGKWIAPDENALAYLKSIRQPTLIVQGSNDAIIPTAHSVTLQQHLPNAQLVIYPDAGHGSIYQYPERFVAHAIQFLNEGPAGMASA
ncbi:alpha/beta fold hydrolase, partial [Alcaligenes phenolicus]